MYLDHFEWRHDLSGVDVLHFAPERYLGAKFRRQSKTYTASNFDPKTPGQGIDICSIPFPDRSFDLVVANHVLEHVPNDRQAMAEICRVLRPGGVAILQTPYTPVLTHSLENPEIKDEAARAVVFGQSDHVRIYGLDLFHRLNKAGLRVTLFRHADVLKHFDSEVWGVNPLEPLIAVRRVQGSDGHGTI